MELHANTKINTPQVIPDGQRITLPGSSAGDLGLYQAQFNMLQRHAEEVFGTTPAPTWAKAREQLREQLKVSPNQHDFAMIDALFGKIREALKDQDLTEAQLNSLMTMVAAMAGTQPHWDSDSQAWIDRLPQSTRNKLVDRALSVDTQGGYTVFRRLWGALVPRNRQMPSLASVGNVNAPNSESF